MKMLMSMEQDSKPARLVELENRLGNPCAPFKDHGLNIEELNEFASLFNSWIDEQTDEGGCLIPYFMAIGDKLSYGISYIQKKEVREQMSQNWRVGTSSILRMNYNSEQPSVWENTGVLLNLGIEE